MKYYVIKTTKNGIEYKRTKCLDYWSKNKLECWQYSRQGAERIANRLNAKLHKADKYEIHYNILEA